MLRRPRCLTCSSALPIWNVDYTYVAAGPAALTAPTPGTTLSGSSATFTWNAASATLFDLFVGTSDLERRLHLCGSWPSCPDRANPGNHSVRFQRDLHVECCVGHVV